MMENFDEYMRDLFHKQEELMTELEIIDEKIKTAINEHNNKCSKEFINRIVDAVYYELN